MKKKKNLRLHSRLLSAEPKSLVFERDDKDTAIVTL